ncbi:MAG: hypothetical protein PUP92_00890 [Rhizonema sp. PD38]|nr:hypothetical protein [Rhizonema sp. PD38]
MDGWTIPTVESYFEGDDNRRQRPAGVIGLAGRYALDERPHTF